MGASLTITVKRPEMISADERAAWITLCTQNPALYSPYFHPAYTELLGELRSDISVIIIYQNQEPAGFLPFQGPQPGRSGFAQPIGAPMTDYHGVICAPDQDFDIVEILKEAGIGAFHFSTLVDSSDQFSAFAQNTHPCTLIDLAGGIQAWREARDSSYRRHLKSHRRRVRKSDEQWGTPRPVFKSKDRTVFDQLVQWKREKFIQTGKYDVLSVDWTQALLRRLWQDGYKELRCDMQVLYFGEHLAAIDLGLTDGDTFHSWMVAYDSEVHTLAPGIQLLEALIDAAPDLGYSRLDLGEGIEGYKRHYATTPVRVTSGFIAVKGPAAALSQIYAAAENFGERAPLGAAGKIPGKVRRRYSQIAACDGSFTGRARAMIDAVKTARRT